MKSLNKDDMLWDAICKEEGFASDVSCCWWIKICWF